MSVYCQEKYFYQVDSENEAASIFLVPSHPHEVNREVKVTNLEAVQSYSAFYNCL